MQAVGLVELVGRRGSIWHPMQRFMERIAPMWVMLVINQYRGSALSEVDMMRGEQ